MDVLHYIFRFFYRIRFWIILGPLLVTLFVIWKTRTMPRTYHTEMTVYTGVVSGYGIESEELGAQNWNILNNTLENIINIITSKETLKNVSFHLYARSMIHGDKNKDNEYITSKNYNSLVAITPKDVLALIDKSSEEKTVQNLLAYEKPTHDNFVYGLFNWYHPHYSYSALQNIKVTRVDNSDILDITYASDDPGIVYQTLSVLNEVYVREYKTLQFGTTNSVIRYFEQELARVGADLREREDSLTIYNIEKRVINYDKQTEQVTSLDRDYELRYQDVMLAYTSSKAAIKHLESGVSENIKNMKTNSEFLHRLNRISDLSTTIAEMSTFRQDSVKASLNYPKLSLDDYRTRLQDEESSFKDFATAFGNQKYTKGGYPTSNFVSQWMDELLKFEKASAELKVLDDFKKELDLQYSHFSPIGSTIKRQERGIDFTEQSYLSILASLNSARLRLKSLEMNSASLKVINPPTFPLDSQPTKRKSLVIAAFVASFIFILSIFLLIEFLDRTLRDKIRTERITSGKVLAAFPRPGKLKQRIYDKAYRSAAALYFGNQLYRYFLPGNKSNIVNLLTIEPDDGINEVAEDLATYWREQGIRVKIVGYGKDFQTSSREFLFAQNINDIIPSEDEDVIIVKHAPLKDAPIPSLFLQNSAVNVLIVQANKCWKDSDNILFKKLIEQEPKAPVLLCLSNAERQVVESFTGMLPPYTFVRKWIYRAYQLGLTSTAN